MEYLYSRFKFLAVISIAVFLYASLCVATKAHSAPLIDLPILQQQVTGVVTDNDGLPIPGVAVRVKDSSTGTVTNSDGVYSINVVPEATLIFSYMGFDTREVSVNSRSEINLSLEEDVTALGEVEVNAGYYYTTRRESTGNISRVTAEELEMQPVLSPLHALQGRMAGVEINTPGGYIGGASTIRIRGTNSLREDGNYPMYIIDGVPVTSTPIESYSTLSGPGIDPLNTMNLSNIESIEVLKDADATAIYGSRGANGVVLITTKKAREGRMELQANIYTGASTVPGRVDMLDTQQYLQIRRKAFDNDEGEIEPTENNAYDLLLWDQKRYTDWQDVIFDETSPVTDVNMSLSGGNEQNNFRLTGSYYKVGTVFIGDKDYNKVTASLQANHSSKDNKLNLNLSINYGVDTNNLFGSYNLTSSAFRLPPNAPSFFKEDGNLNWEEWDVGGLTNPLEGYFNSSVNRGHNLTSNMVVTYELLKGISFRTNLGYTNFNGDEVNLRPRKSYSPSNQQNNEHSSTTVLSQSNSWIIEPQLLFNKQIGNHNIDAIIGGTLQQNKRSMLVLTAEGYITESLIGNISAAETIISNNNPTTEYRYNAIFGRIGYNWDKKLFLNLTGRRDGSSRFGPGKRTANFGAIGAAWIFSEENFIKQNLSFLSFGKIRGSYGTTGSDHIGDYGYLDAYEVTTGPGGLFPNQLANPDYSWEENKKLELALDLGFLRDRLNLAVSWFQNRSSSQLVGYPLPLLTGFSSIQANFPATVENTGFEIEATSYPVQNKNFQWQTSFNFTLPKNQLLEYPNIEESSYANIYRVGYPLNISFKYNYTGIDPETGFYTVEDVNEDGRINTDDRKEIWVQDKEFFGGFSNNLTYKNFSLQFLLQFVKQEGTLGLFDAGAPGNQRVEVMDALGPNSAFQRISTSFDATRAYLNVFNDSMLPVVDASYIKLRTLSLAYSLPNPLLNSLGLEKANIFLNGQNLLTVTSYKGLDPEVPFSGTSFSGLRTITAGIQLTL